MKRVNRCESVLGSITPGLSLSVGSSIAKVAFRCDPELHSSFAADPIYPCPGRRPAGSDM
jgi:hypothetical protein